jgi:hypothetical protein
MYKTRLGRPPARPAPGRAPHEAPTNLERELISAPAPATASRSRRAKQTMSVRAVLGTMTYGPDGQTKPEQALEQ